MKILITGALGHIGSGLIRELVKIGGYEKIILVDNFLTQRYRNFADFYTRRFIDYMSFNASTKFPEYYNNVNDDMYPDKSANFVSFVT